MPIFYRPADGFVGDVIPFYWQGLFHAFYLKAALPPDRVGAEGTPIAHIVSADLAHWEKWPPAVSPGAPGRPDASGCWTGSVVERDGVFHLFYTGHAGPNIPPDHLPRRQPRPARLGKRPAQPRPARRSALVRPHGLARPLPLLE
jgi:sucrose-6-phosphate hydrolase SacC (GH32 family)